LNESGTRLYSDLEIDLLIDEISEAALEAIEQAAGEAARAAVLAMLEREASILREMSYQQAEALRWRSEAENSKRKGIRNAVITGLVCLTSGLIAGMAINK
jgi:hypothetical protein